MKLKMICLVLVSIFGSLTAVAGPTSASSTLVSNAAMQPLAVYQEALSYLLGRNGKDKSAEKAADLFKALAEHNWASAQHMLGNLYYKGKGVEKNDLLAYKWLSIAARNNARLAQVVSDKRKAIQLKLSDDRLEKVEQWIAEWRPSQQLAENSALN